MEQLMTPAERRAWFADARALLSMLESRPAVPLPRSGLHIQYIAGLDGATDDEARAEVGIAAGALGVDTSTNTFNHYRTRYTTGSASYSAVAIPGADMQRHDEERRLGAEAYEALHAPQEHEAAA